MKKLATENRCKTEKEISDKTIPINRNETSSGVARVPDQFNGTYITK
jgi:hypothetical protein